MSDLKTGVVTDEEHHARAMLLGMHYHHGNGSPFYYIKGDDDAIIITTMIDANTLKPLVAEPFDTNFVSAAVYNVKNRIRRR